ncbi:hypothetical protein CR513_08393, partial [Mucuna pruriens]
MIEAVGNYGSHLKPPSYHELRVPLLKKELKYTKDLLKSHEKEQLKYKYSNIQNKTLINVLVNCSLGIIFIKSVDIFEYMKTKSKILQNHKTKIVLDAIYCQCLDSILENIAKVQRAIQKASNL